MKLIRLTKAAPLGGEAVESATIVIDCDVDICTSQVTSLDEVRQYYDDQAQILVDTLLGSLPQGIIEPLMVKLMQHRASLYMGLMR